MTGELVFPRPGATGAMAASAMAARYGERWIKRIFDIVAVLAGGIVILPVLLLVGLLIKADSPGPILFKQRRVGLHGEAFWIFKFRTMIADAEILRSDLSCRNQASGPLFKIENDPRITRVGRFLRRTSLDELPQLLNVLRGEMSLIGPRPLPVDDWEPFRDSPYEERHSVLPGMTGLWQISGRSLAPGGRMLELDSVYVRSRSLWLDLKILLMTVPVVLGRRGAC